MFTPPPSPLPPKRAGSPKPESEVNAANEQHKRRTARRFRTAAFIVPLALILFTACATLTTQQFLHGSTHEGPLSWFGGLERSSPAAWMLHKREPDPNPQPQASSPSSSTNGISSSSSTPTASNQQPMPVVPNSAPAALPTPFLQPFGSSLGQNFTAPSCQNFFNNMTSTIPFRSCRSFALLQSSSDEFINAQANMTFLNAIIWGTCNTMTPFDQCKLNMNWFADSLKRECAQELKDQNIVVAQTLIGLKSYQIMHDAGCLIDPTSNTYCYINAVRQTNPSDLYYYNMPLGTPLPRSQNTKLTCSSCSRSVMGLYSSALKDSSQPDLTALKTAYNPSADFAASQCGADFANGVASSAQSFKFGGAVAVLLPALIGMSLLLR